MESKKWKVGTISKLQWCRICFGAQAKNHMCFRGGPTNCFFWNFFYAVYAHRNLFCGALKYIYFMFLFFLASACRGAGEDSPFALLFCTIAPPSPPKDRKRYPSLELRSLDPVWKLFENVRFSFGFLDFLR